MARIPKSEIEKEKMEILSHLRNNIKKANLRLTLLEKYYGKDSWASSILKERLGSPKVQALTLTGRVEQADESMSLSKLRAIDKATKNFIESKTSTLSGIKEVRKNVIKKFRTEFGDEDVDKNKLKKLSLEDSQTLYSILEDKDTVKFVEKIDSSKTLTLIANNIKKQSGRNTFYKDIYNNLLDKGSMDTKTKKQLQKIYKKIKK